MSNASAISNKVRCCFLGQPGLGKTTLVLRLLLGKYFPACDPTLEDTFTVNVPYKDGTVVAFEVDDWCAANEWETSDASVRRSFRHQEPRLVVLCFSLVDISSFKAVVDEWYPAIMKWEPRVKILLVGTKSDAEMSEADLDNLRLQHVGPIPREQCHALAREIEAYAYIECSAKDDHGIQELRHALLEVGKEPIPRPTNTAKVFLKEKHRPKIKTINTCVSM